MPASATALQAEETDEASSQSGSRFLQAVLRLSSSGSHIPPPVASPTTAGAQQRMPPQMHSRLSRDGIAGAGSAVLARRAAFWEEVQPSDDNEEILKEEGEAPILNPPLLTPTIDEVWREHDGNIW